MRFFGLHSQLNSIRRQLRTGRRQISQEQLQRYAADGTLPDDELTLAYVRLNANAIEAMNASVAESDHEAACERYQQALYGWRQALKGGAK